MARAQIMSLRLEDASIGQTMDEAVCHNITFDIPVGKIYWLKGEGGLGKSFLLRILAGLSDPAEGRLVINDRRLQEMSFHDFLPYRLNIGYGFDSGGLLNNKSIYENLMLPLEYHGEILRQQAHERVQQALTRFKLTAFKNVRPALVSGSIRKLTCVLRAFVHQPTLVLLDDASTGLSEIQKDQLASYIAEYQIEHQATFVITTQDSNFMERLNCSILEMSRDHGIRIVERAARAA